MGNRYPSSTAKDNDPDDRSAINTERMEYTKSGTDNAVAAQRCSWDTVYMTPEEVREESIRESQRDGNDKPCPLEISPANREWSKFTDESGRGVWVEHSVSRRVSPPKGKKVDYGGAAVTEINQQIVRSKT